MTTATVTPIRPTELWMQVRDLDRLKRLMAIHDLSGRQLSDIANYQSHTYVQRLLRGDVDTLKVEPAVRIAHYFRVPVEDLFLTRSSSEAVEVRQVSKKYAAKPPTYTTHTKRRRAA